MKDFNTYFNDQGKGQDMNNAEDLVKQVAGAFEGKGEADILRAIYKEAERGRKAGTLTDAELDNFYLAVAPMLDSAKRKKLEQVVAKLKKTK